MNPLGLKDSDLTLFVSGFEIDVIYVIEHGKVIAFFGFG